MNAPLFSGVGLASSAAGAALAGLSWLAAAAALAALPFLVAGALLVLGRHGLPHVAR
jgi:hypothetical protein